MVSYDQGETDIDTPTQMMNQININLNKLDHFVKSLIISRGKHIKKLCEVVDNFSGKTEETRNYDIRETMK